MSNAAQSKAYRERMTEEQKERRRELGRIRYRANIAHYREKSLDYYHQNRSERIEYAQRWRDESPEKCAEGQRRYALNNKQKKIDAAQRRRARILNAPVVEAIDRSAIYERDSGRCHICGKTVPPDAFSLDHLVPLVRGGEHSSLNLRVAHRQCNSRRGAGRLPAQLLLVG